jgi:hypothetical protein
LKAVVKCFDVQNGRYTAYTRTEDGQWWSCVGADVRKATIGEVNNKKNGDAYLAFYQQEERASDGFGYRPRRYVLQIPALRQGAL